MDELLTPEDMPCGRLDDGTCVEHGGRWAAKCDRAARVAPSDELRAAAQAFAECSTPVYDWRQHLDLIRAALATEQPDRTYPSTLCECGHPESHHVWTCGICEHKPPYEDTRTADPGGLDDVPEATAPEGADRG